MVWTGTKTQSTAVTSKKTGLSKSTTFSRSCKSLDRREADFGPSGSSVIWHRAVLQGCAYSYCMCKFQFRVKSAEGCGLFMGSSWAPEALLVQRMRCLESKFEVSEWLQIEVLAWKSLECDVSWHR